MSVSEKMLELSLESLRTRPNTMSAQHILSHILFIPSINHILILPTYVSTKVCSYKLSNDLFKFQPSLTFTPTRFKIDMTGKHLLCLWLLFMPKNCTYITLIQKHELDHQHKMVMSLHKTLHAACQ